MSSPEPINISVQSAVACWGLEHETCSLEALRFDLTYDPATGTAFFKLRATATFASDGGGSERTTAAWLFIAPERIETVNLEYEDKIDDASSDRVGPETVYWHFVLTRPGTLVLPPDHSLKPEDQLSGQSIGGLWALAQATRFSISGRLPARAVSRERLVSFCKVISRPRRTGDAAASTHAKLTSNRHAADTASLYGGRGGRTVEFDTLDLTSPARGEAPPLYTDLEDSPPVEVQPPNGKKRRRRRSSVTSATPSRRLDIKRATEHAALLKAAIDDCKSQLMSEIRTEMKAEIKAQVQSDVREGVNEILQDLEKRITSHVEERLQEQTDDLERQIYDLDHQVANTIYADIEDQTYAARMQLEDFVREEMGETRALVEERLLDRFESAYVNIRFADR